MLLFNSDSWSMIWVHLYGFHLLSQLWNQFFCWNFMAEYIGQRRPLGGLLLLLPPTFSPHYTNTEGLAHHDSAKDLVKEILTEVERLLIHANIPVSGRISLNFVDAVNDTVVIHLITAKLFDQLDFKYSFDFV